MAHDEHKPHLPSSSPPVGSWDHVYPHSHHGTPAQEYSGFTFGGLQLPMDLGTLSSPAHNVPPRPAHQQLHPLIMPQWPSMLPTQAESFQPVYPQPVQPLHLMSIGPLPTPISAASLRSATIPRKTLTDQDRRRMCQYAEENPNSKQTEIGAIFGVERSTVSKVLRQKEKYLFQEDGSRSPVKRAKGRSPDIERALAVWAKNQEKKGAPLTDEIIRDKARAFAATTTSLDNHQVMSASWIEKFKLKNNLMGARSRKGSLAPDDAESLTAAAAAAPSSHASNDVSPVSPRAPASPSPIDLHSAHSHESLKNESPDSYLDSGSGHGTLQSESATSLNSAFTDNGPSYFSPGALSPSSSIFTPDSGTAPSPFVPGLAGAFRPLLPATPTNAPRPRSQTFPFLDQYMGSSGGGAADAITPKYVTSSVLDSPMEEVSEPEPEPALAPAPASAPLDASRPPQPSPADERPHTVTPAETMRPPPLPAHVRNADVKRETTPSRAPALLRQATTPEEALQALEVVHSFFEQQPNGFLDFQESVTMGKLMEKLKLHSRNGSVGG